MFFGQVTETGFFKEEFIAPVGKMGLAGKIVGCHCGAVGVMGCLAGLASVSAVVFVALNGLSVSGKVARRAAAGSEGKYRGPCWPQADRLTALAPRTNVLTRI